MLYKMKEESKNLFILELVNRNGLVYCRKKLANRIKTDDIILFLNEEKNYSYYGPYSPTRTALKFLHKENIVWIDKKDIIQL